jgi:hypothetical protein
MKQTNGSKMASALITPATKLNALPTVPNKAMFQMPEVWASGNSMQATTMMWEVQ